MSSPSTKIIPFSGYNNIGVDFINEETAAQGVAVDQSTGGRGTLLKDGGLGLENTSWAYARNAANNAEVNLIRLNSSDRMEFGSALKWIDWSGSMTITPGGAMTVSSSTVFRARYVPLGGLTILDFQLSVTFGGVASTFFDVLAPVSPSFNMMNMCYLDPPIAGSTAKVGYLESADAVGKIRVFRIDASNYPLATLIVVSGQLSYG